MAYFAFAILHPSDQALSRSCASQVRFLGKTQDVSANQKSLEGELRFKRGANVLELCGTRRNSRYFYCDAAYACAGCYRVQCYAPNFQRALVVDGYSGQAVACQLLRGNLRESGPTK